MNKHIIKLIAGLALMGAAIAEMFEDVGIGLEHGALVFGAAHAVLAVTDLVEGYRTAHGDE